LNDPKPAVVGIAWVVECVEQRMRVDTEKFQVDLEHENVAGINKVSSPADSEISPDALLSVGDRCFQSICPYQLILVLMNMDHSPMARMGIGRGKVRVKFLSVVSLTSLQR
jgi:hypothetical protein